MRRQAAFGLFTLDPIENLAQITFYERCTKYPGCGGVAHVLIGKPFPLFRDVR